MYYSFNNWEKRICQDGTFEWFNKESKQTQKINPTSTIYLLEAAFMDNIAFVGFYIENNGDINIVDKKGRNGIYLLTSHSFTLFNYE